MTTLVDNVVTLIQADTPSMAILTGGIYTRPLTRDKTPAAFTTDLESYKCAATIVGPQYAPHPQFIDQTPAYTGGIDIDVYCQANKTEKDKVESLIGHLIRILIKEQPYLNTPFGPRAFPRFAGASAAQDSEEFTGASYRTIRFELDGMFFVPS